MICEPCRTRHHETCKGGTWCDCQHRPPGTATDQPKAAHPEEQTA